MKEVLINLFLVCVVFSVFFAGCATTTQTSGARPDITVTESVAAERIFFPDYNLSINRPPEKWEMLEDPGEGEIAIWLNREAGSVIEIMVSRAVRNLSYHNIAVEFNRITCDLVQQRSPTVSCVIVDEKVVSLNRNEFYRVKIIYQGIFHDVAVRSLVYLHRTEKVVYHFLFMEEKQNIVADEMMQSVAFHDRQKENKYFAKSTDPQSLIDACYYGDRETVENLINTGVDINARNQDGVTALSYASDRGHMDIVKLLLANNAEVNAMSNIGSTALMNASYMGHVKIVKELVASGADVNAQSNDGTTALMNAAAQGYKEIAEILLANAADVNACEKCGLNALWNAISSGHDDIVKVLVSHGADVNTRANDGTTALMNAAFTGSTDIVKRLLEAGAEVNAKADNGLTALILAKRQGYAEIVRLLIEAGAFEDSPRGIGLNYEG